MAKTSTKAPAAGIDVGKLWLDVAVGGSGPEQRFANDPQGLRELIAFLRKHRVARVGLEASGGYERDAARALRKAGFTVIVLQPIQVRAYATYRRRRAKNDQIDARLIAACTECAEEREAPDERLTAFADHLTYIEQVVEDIARLKTRREACRDARLKGVYDDDLKRLMARRNAERARLEKAIRAHADLAARLDLILSVPGVGLPTAIEMLVRLPELGRVSREAIAALVGVAPYDDDSGLRRGERHIAGGRERIRKSLYAAALPAAFRWNDALGELYKRLIANGKSHKCALIACVRKLVICVNAILARGTPWTPETPQT
jgi:transposase